MQGSPPKSTLLLEIAESNGLEDAARIHIDFSEIVWTEFSGTDPEEWTRLYEVALSLHSHPVFLLDEIQEVAEFSRGVRTLPSSSVRCWYNELQSEGVRVGKDTLYGYLSNLQEAFFFFVVKNVAAPTGNRKVYTVDNGLYSRVRNRPDLGKLLENQVFVDLLRQGSHPQFLRNEKGEIDFITDDWMIQVCLELSEANRGREERPLTAGNAGYPGRKAAIVTFDNYPEFAESLGRRD